MFKKYFVSPSKKPFFRTRGWGGGRPVLLRVDDAFNILRVVRTGMQWRSLCPTAAVACITLFKTMHTWIDADLFQTAYRAQCSTAEKINGTITTWKVVYVGHLMMDICSLDRI